MSLILFTKGNINTPKRKYKKMQMAGPIDTDPLTGLRVRTPEALRRPQTEILDFSTKSLMPSVSIPKTLATTKMVSPTFKKEREGLNLEGAGSLLQDIAPYASNVANMFRRVPSPMQPQLEGETTANLVDFSGDRAALERDRAGVNMMLEANSPNSAAANANKVASLASFLEAKGKLSQAERNTNANIKNQVAGVNAGIRGRNVGRLNEYQDAIINRQLAEQRLSQENLADFATKYGMQSRDKSMMALENRKLDMLPVQFKDSGVVDRNLLAYLEKEGYLKKKYGGKIKY